MQFLGMKQEIVSDVTKHRPKL